MRKCNMSGTIAKILVIDDNPKYISEALPMYGYDVEVATDGLQAMKILSNNRTIC